MGARVVRPSRDGRALTVTELRGIAGEAGFGTPAVERAIAEALEQSRAEPRRSPIEKRGFIRLQVWTLRTIPIELTSDQLLYTLRLLQPYHHGPPRVAVEEGQLTWRDGKGLIFHLQSGPGVTELRVRISKITLFRRRRLLRWIGSAADRLETLLTLVAARDHTTTPLLGPSGVEDR